MTVGQPDGVSTPARALAISNSAYSMPATATARPVKVHSRSGIDENWINESTAMLTIFRRVQRDWPCRRGSRS